MLLSTIQELQQTLEGKSDFITFTFSNLLMPISSISESVTSVSCLADDEKMESDEATQESSMESFF